jgi:predicted phosphoadenosine phosphosulfate sulfurtransferase
MLITIKRTLAVDVLTAAKQRIRNIFANGLPVYLSFSGGKDSLVLADITAKLVQAGEIDVSQLHVQFIDEEAIFPCVEDIVKEWRAKFLLMGARFNWYCLEVKHFNCLNQLENDETFICWDRYKEDCWIRQPPAFAIRTHAKFQSSRGRTTQHGPRVDSYQTFLSSIDDGPHMTGVRVAESLQRRDAISRKTHATSRPSTLGGGSTLEPIYDWEDDDVWHYLRENNIKVPAAYMHLYQIGVARRNMRISQFFSIDTAHALARMAEFYPGLMERILRREPNAYIVSLYWDSELFRRRSQRRRDVEKINKPQHDPRGRVLDLIQQIEATAPDCPRQQRSKTCPCKRCLARDYQNFLLRPFITARHYDAIYDALVAGDPKRRSLRALNSNIRQGEADRLNLPRAQVPEQRA